MHPSTANPSATARFLELLDADGIVSRIGDVVSVQGVSVPEASLEAVVAKLRPLATRGVASSDKLSTLDQSAESCASEASGASDDTGRLHPRASF